MLEKILSDFKTNLSKVEVNIRLLIQVCGLLLVGLSLNTTPAATS